MSLKNEFRSLLEQGKSIITDLQKSADMAPREKILKQNGSLSQTRAEELIRNLHEIVNTFGTNLQSFINTVVKDKTEILESHSDEIIQCVDYISSLCTMAENLLTEGNLQVVTSFGPKLKAEFLKSLKECEELKLVDYETFTSVDIEADFSGLFHSPIVNIISRNPRSSEKQILHSLSLGNSDNNTGLSWGQQAFGDSKHISVDQSGHGTLVHQSFVMHGHKQSSTNNLQTQQNNINRKLTTIPESPDQEMVNLDVSIRTESDSWRDPNNRETQMDADLLSLDQSPGLSWEPMDISKINTAAKAAGITPVSNLPNTDTLTDLVQRCEAFGFGNKTSQAQKGAKPGEAGDAALKSHFDHVRPCYMNQPTEETSKSSGNRKSSRTDVIANWRDMQAHSSEMDPNLEQKVSPIGRQGLKADQESAANRGASGDRFGRVKTTNANLRNTGTSAIKKEPDEMELEIRRIESALRSDLSIPHGISQGPGGTEETWEEPKHAALSSQHNKNSQEFAVKEEQPSLKSIAGKAEISREDRSSAVEGPWNLSNIEPLKITFDLRSVMPTIRHGVPAPEIKAELVKKISGGTSTSFDHPTGLTVMTDGRLVVADTGNNVVKVLQDNTLFLVIGKNDGVKFVRPSAVVTDNRNNLYVKDDICVQIFDSHGKLLKSVGQKIFNSPYGLALVKPSSHPFLMVIDSGRRGSTVHRYLIEEDRLQSYPYNPLIDHGTPTSKVRFLAAFNSIMLASDLGASAMYLSHLDGRTLKTFGRFGYNVAEFREPSGVTVDAVGNWMVADSKNNRVQVFTNDGHFLALLSLSSPIRRPSDIHLTSDGQLYVMNYLDGVVSVFQLRR